MSPGKSITPELEWESSRVMESRYIDGKGTGYTVSEKPSERLQRPVGFRMAPSSREYGEALWTARDIL